MKNLLIQIDSSEINEGKTEEVKTAFNELVEFVKAKEPAIISYNVYFSEGDKEVTVVQVHPGVDSFEYHMTVGGPEFSKFKNLLKMKTIEIYGTPGERLLSHIRKKAAMHGTAEVSVHHLHSGINRFKA